MAKRHTSGTSLPNFYGMYSTSVISYGHATCSGISVLPHGSAGWDRGYDSKIEDRLHKLERKLGGGITMQLYEVFVVDTKKLTVLKQQYCFGEDESDAMSDVDLTDEMKALKKRQRVAVLARVIGDFEPFAVVHIETDADDQ